MKNKTIIILVSLAVIIAGGVGFFLSGDLLQGRLKVQSSKVSTSTNRDSFSVQPPKVNTSTSRDNSPTVQPVKVNTSVNRDSLDLTKTAEENAKKSVKLAETLAEGYNRAEYDATERIVHKIVVWQDVLRTVFTEEVGTGTVQFWDGNGILIKPARLSNQVKIKNGINFKLCSDGSSLVSWQTYAVKSTHTYLQAYDRYGDRTADPGSYNSKDVLELDCL